MILILDNYDSFTYQLVQYFQILAQEVLVFLNDAISLEAIEKLQPTHIVISPGPKRPEDAGISLSLIQHFYQQIPILGICLGHQCLAQAFDVSIISAPSIFHGKKSPIQHHRQGLFQGLPNGFNAQCYHSLVIDPATLPSSFAIDAWTESQTIMAISHRSYPLYGLQFHPESILSEHGLDLLSNFLKTSAKKEKFC